MNEVENDKDINKLFKLVFNNIVLSRLIFNFSRLYKINECKSFKSRKEILDYQDKEYIHKLEYSSIEMLDIGDLPTNGVLKEVILKEIISIQGDVIPYGVERIEFGRHYKVYETTPLPTLPSTIHTANNISITSKNCYDIPSNITTLSFIYCPNISGHTDKRGGFMIIPNTIKNLTFCNLWNNQNLKLTKGDIPDGIINLSFQGFPIENFNQDSIPNTVKELSVESINFSKFHMSNIVGYNLKAKDSSYYKSSDYINGLFNFITTSNVETLHIKIDSCLNITRFSNLYKCNSIKKLVIILQSSYETNTIQENSLPNNLNELNLHFNNTVNEIISKDSIPNSVKKLTVNRIIKEIYLLPSSLTHLLYKKSTNTTKEDLIEMISILPPTLTSITLPLKYNEYDLIFSPTIKEMIYEDLD